MRKPALLLILILWLSLPAWCHDPAGDWTSSSGNRVNIWANMEQVVVTVTDARGKAYRYQGQWERFSDTFQYRAGNITYRAAFQDPNTLIINAPGKPTHTWTRGWTGAARRPIAPQPAAAYNPTGLYTSTTGASVQINSQGRQIFVTIIGANGSRSQGSGRWLSANRFDYSVPGRNGAATCTIDTNNPNLIYVQSPGRQGYTTWTRQ